MKLNFPINITLKDEIKKKQINNNKKRKQNNLLINSI